jgi:hypothetical protein
MDIEDPTSVMMSLPLWLALLTYIRRKAITLEREWISRFHSRSGW